LPLLPARCLGGEGCLLEYPRKICRSGAGALLLCGWARRPARDGGLCPPTHNLPPARARTLLAVR